MNSGTSASSACQAAAKRSRSASIQWLSAIIFSGRLMVLHRPDQPHAPFDLAVVEHEARRRDLHGGAAGALVDEQRGARIGEMVERLVQRHRTIAPALR